MTLIVWGKEGVIRDGKNNKKKNLIQPEASTCIRITKGHAGLHLKDLVNENWLGRSYKKLWGYPMLGA